MPASNNFLQSYLVKNVNDGQYLTKIWTKYNNLHFGLPYIYTILPKKLVYLSNAHLRRNSIRAVYSIQCVLKLIGIINALSVYNVQ